MIFDDMRRILHEKRELPMSSDRIVRIVLLFLEIRAEDQLAVAVQNQIWAVLPFEENARSIADSRFKLKD